MNTLNLLKEGSHSPPLYLRALVLFFFQFCTVACFAGVIYEYRQQASASVIATIEIQSPPASGNAGWSTTAPSDLIALFLSDAVFGLGTANVLSLGGSVGLSGISSLAGARLDAGTLGITFPSVLPSDPAAPTIDRSLSIQFDVPDGGDFIGLATISTFPNGQVLVADLFVFGDWLAQGTAAVAEPGTLTLVGVAFFAVGWMRGRKRGRS
jgi:hypothetical protein